MAARKRRGKKQKAATSRPAAAVKGGQRSNVTGRRSPRERIVDAIRIVPIAAPKELFPHVATVPPAPPPSLTYRGGPLLAAAHVFTLYVGSAWSNPQLKAVATQLDAFFTFVLTSELIDQLAEYDVPGVTIGHGTFVGSSTLSSIKPPASVTDAWLQQTLQQAIAAGAPVPKPGPDSLYFLYLPPGITLVQGSARSCQAFCGYHDSIGSTTFYAAMPYPNCTGCLGNLSVLDALTSTSSHELCEAITDPVPGTGWYDDANGEIGDICAWQTRKLGAYTVQLEWSNAQRRCV
jgi:hypothetical protein